MTTFKAAALAASLASTFLAPPSAYAQRGGWGPAWSEPGWDGPMRSPASRDRFRDPRDGQVDVSRFVASGAAAAELGHGSITVTSDSGEGPWVDPSARAAYEAAVVDALVSTGYDTVHAGGERVQVAKLQISRRVLTPAEDKKSPVSGSAAMSVGSHGYSAYGLAINVDMTKPRSALVSTRLDARIIDQASGRVLWEGYATIATYEGDDKWSDGAIATKLARALFDKFPKADGTVPVSQPVAVAQPDEPLPTKP